MAKLQILTMDKNLRTIFVFALRYSIPRHTYSFDMVSEYIRQHIKGFEYGEIEGMIDDCRIFYPDDDFGGKTCDQPAVDRFVELLKDELEKRMNGDE